MLRWQKALIYLAVLGLPSAINAQNVSISAPEEMAATGVFDYILPRFRLKTQISVGIAAPENLSFNEASGQPVFSWNGTVWRVETISETEEAQKFVDWLLSDVGQNTLAAFRLGDAQVFFRPELDAAPIEVASESEDTTKGMELAHLHCGRCHVVSKRNSMGGIGSTPSFGAMKNFPDWEAKFAGFFTLNPHPSFTQIEGFTEPFDPTRPSPIAPVELTEAEYDAIISYIYQIPVKDLGGAVIAK